MKHIHRFFIKDPLTSGRSVRLDEDDSFHAAKVLRLKPGDLVELADGSGRVFMATISSDGREHGALVAALPGAELGSGRPIDTGAGLSVVQAIPRGRKFDLVVEKLSEIGVARLTPVLSARSVSRDVRSWREKVERWRRIARSAAAQAKRIRIMEVAEPVVLAEWLKSFSGTLLVLATEIPGTRLGEALDGNRSAGGVGGTGGLGSYAASGSGSGDVIGAGAPGAGDIGAVGGVGGVGGAGGVSGPGGQGLRLALVIGPEAGFAPDELRLLEGAGARFVSLGPLVLRTETAALVAAAIVMHRRGEIG